ncbi:MAG: hypothetical protein JO348_01980 [Alphaproteobacteria bacterium]|nr:hypothetical protein [Alphaproteobacteria bacterium]MBV9418518.1 hypothetical protein [Alphaproteobacteria bacterium]
MSAMGIAAGPGFKKRPQFISAKADYRRSDFVFNRTQSLNMRAMPWERRLKPLRSWSDIGAYAGSSVIAAITLLSVILSSF